MNRRMLVLPGLPRCGAARLWIGATGTGGVGAWPSSGGREHRGVTLREGLRCTGDDPRGGENARELRTTGWKRVGGRTWRGEVAEEHDADGEERVRTGVGIVLRWLFDPNPRLENDAFREADEGVAPWQDDAKRGAEEDAATLRLTDLGVCPDGCNVSFPPHPLVCPRARAARPL